MASTLFPLFNFTPSPVPHLSWNFALTFFPPFNFTPSPIPHFLTSLFSPLYLFSPFHSQYFPIFHSCHFNHLQFPPLHTSSSFPPFSQHLLPFSIFRLSRSLPTSLPSPGIAKLLLQFPQDFFSFQTTNPIPLSQKPPNPTPSPFHLFSHVFLRFVFPSQIQKNGFENVELHFLEKENSNSIEFYFSIQENNLLFYSHHYCCCYRQYYRYTYLFLGASIAPL
jgi:hypothetical protein